MFFLSDLVLAQPNLNQASVPSFHLLHPVRQSYLLIQSALLLIYPFVLAVSLKVKHLKALELVLGQALPVTEVYCHHQNKIFFESSKDLHYDVNVTFFSLTLSCFYYSHIIPWYTCQYLSNKL